MGKRGKFEISIVLGAACAGMIIWTFLQDHRLDEAPVARTPSGEPGVAASKKTILHFSNLGFKPAQSDFFPILFEKECASARVKKEAVDYLYKDLQDLAVLFEDAGKPRCAAAAAQMLRAKLEDGLTHQHVDIFDARRDSCLHEPKSCEKEAYQGGLEGYDVAAIFATGVQLGHAGEMTAELENLLAKIREQYALQLNPECGASKGSSCFRDYSVAAAAYAWIAAYENRRGHPAQQFVDQARKSMRAAFSASSLCVMTRVTGKGPVACKGSVPDVVAGSATASVLVNNSENLPVALEDIMMLASAEAGLEQAGARFVPSKEERTLALALWENAQSRVEVDREGEASFKEGSVPSSPYSTPEFFPMGVFFEKIFDVVTPVQKRKIAHQSYDFSRFSEKEFTQTAREPAKKIFFKTLGYEWLKQSPSLDAKPFAVVHMNTISPADRAGWGSRACNSLVVEGKVENGSKRDKVLIEAISESNRFRVCDPQKPSRDGHFRCELKKLGENRHYKLVASYGAARDSVEVEPWVCVGATNQCVDSQPEFMGQIETMNIHADEGCTLEVKGWAWSTPEFQGTRVNVKVEGQTVLRDLPVSESRALLATTKPCVAGQPGWRMNYSPKGGYFKKDTIKVEMDVIGGNKVAREMDYQIIDIPKECFAHADAKDLRIAKVERGEQLSYRWKDHLVIVGTAPGYEPGTVVEVTAINQVTGKRIVTRSIVGKTRHHLFSVGLKETSTQDPWLVSAVVGPVRSNQCYFEGERAPASVDCPKSSAQPVEPFKPEDSK